MDRVKIASKLVKIAKELVAIGGEWDEDAFLELPRGTYIRTTHGEGKVGDKLPTGSRIVKTVDRVERKVSFGEVTGVWNKGKNGWDKV